MSISLVQLVNLVSDIHMYARYEADQLGLQCSFFFSHNLFLTVGDHLSIVRVCDKPYTVIVIASIYVHFIIQVSKRSLG